MVKSYSFHAVCWICRLTYCRRRNTENWALYLHALWVEGGSLHQRNSSISELVCSSMSLIGFYLCCISATVLSLNLCVHQASIATGLVNCTVFRQDTPLKKLRFLKRKHNSFHGGTGTTFLEVPAEVPDIVNAWKAHILARNLKYDSFSRTGQTRYAQTYFCFVKKLTEGLFSNQERKRQVFQGERLQLPPR